MPSNTRKLNIRFLRQVWLAASLCAAASNLSAQIDFIEQVIPTPDSFPDGLTLGPDGAVWFTEYGAGKIGRMESGGSITEYPVPTPDSAPYGITVGPDGALWFTEYFTNKIGRITTRGIITEYKLPTANSFPAQIVSGPDGALWFTEFTANKIGRITIQGVITEYNLAPDSNPRGIAVGPDGAIWFTTLGTHKIGRITRAGAITEYAIPTEFSSPQSITAGPDGALWFTEQSANKIGRITPSGVITEYPAAGGPMGITLGPDGALWFTENHGLKIGRITTAGSLTEYTVPRTGRLQGITVGPHGAIWFAENSSNLIGRVVYQTATLSVSPQDAVPGTTVTASGTKFAAGENVGLSDGVGLFRFIEADSTGAFTFTTRLRTAPFGSNTLVALGQNSSRLGVGRYSITPLLILNPTIVRPGDRVRVTGVGFRSHDSIDLYVNDDFSVGETAADRYGSIAGANAVVFPILRHVPPGVYTVLALGSNGVSATAEFVVQ